MTEIGEAIFNGCTSLTDVTIPDSVYAIGCSFQDCVNLTELTLPDSVTEIGENAFYGNYNISVTYKSRIYAYDRLDDLYAAINV